MATDYLKVIWHHELDDEPVELFSELDSVRMEIRKVEVYRDGRYDFADANRSSGSTQLSDGPLPTFEEILGMADFTPTYISADEFERVWRQATAA